MTVARPPLLTPHGPLERPAFLPDGTRGVVQTASPPDVRATGTRAMMVNALHLASTPGTSVVAAAGGIHSFMSWDGVVASDSGGYQVFSLLAAKPPLASVSDRGFSYSPRRGQRRRLLSAERSVEDQLRIGADILFCLDHCTHPDEPAGVQRQSVDHTLRWAGEARRSFDAAMQRREAGERPKLFAVVQGGLDVELRRRCAEGLLELGFDGFGYGGWPIANDGRLLEMVGMVAALLPPEAPKHALGIGRPENVVAAWRAGYDMFDCTLPTKLGRRGLAYVMTGGEPDTDPTFYAQLDVTKQRYRRDGAPLEDGCDCETCGRHSRSYLAHLLDIGDALGQRLVTVHNLRFYARLMERLAAEAGA